MAYPYAGKSGSVTIGGTAKPLAEWTVEIDGDPIDYTNFTSSGWRQFVCGLKKATIKASGPYNGVATGAAASDASGGTATFLLDPGSSAPTFTFTSALMTKHTIRQTVEGVAMIDYEAVAVSAPTLSY